MQTAYPAHWEADVVLRDGGVVHVRPIRPEDAEAVHVFHAGQSAESIYLRFFAPLPRLSDREVARFTQVDYMDRVGLVATLAHLGRLVPGEHVIETPVGDVVATLHGDGRVSVRNVPAYRLAADVAVTLPTGQVVTGDIAWGGNWFFLCADHGQAVAPDQVGPLTDYAAALADALHAQGHRGADGAVIDHIELFADADPALADSRSFVLCPGRQYDRSPCGTGTSAKLACLAARGQLAPGEAWRQASVIGSVFEGSYRRAGDTVAPTIRGTAWISAESTLLFDDGDPFAWGIPA